MFNIWIDNESAYEIKEPLEFILDDGHKDNSCFPGGCITLSLYMNAIPDEVAGFNFGGLGTPFSTGRHAEILNGEQQVSYYFTFKVPTEEGEILIPENKISFGDKLFTIEPFTLVVTAQAVVTAKDSLYLADAGLSKSINIQSAKKNKRNRKLLVLVPVALGLMSIGYERFKKSKTEQLVRYLYGQSMVNCQFRFPVLASYKSDNCDTVGYSLLLDTQESIVYNFHLIDSRLPVNADNELRVYITDANGKAYKGDGRILDTIPGFKYALRCAKSRPVAYDFVENREKQRDLGTLKADILKELQAETDDMKELFCEVYACDNIEELYRKITVSTSFEELILCFG